MPAPSTSKAGDAKLVKVGHTIGRHFGSNPMAQQKGKDSPTEITFKG